MKFIDRLVTIANDCVRSKIGEWNDFAFFVYDINDFIEFIKPYPISTFRRQLHYYGFKYAISRNSNEFLFQHPQFTESNYNLIERSRQKRINRKRNRKRKMAKVDTDVDTAADPVPVPNVAVADIIKNLSRIGKSSKYIISRKETLGVKIYYKFLQRNRNIFRYTFRFSNTY